MKTFKVKKFLLNIVINKKVYNNNYNNRNLILKIYFLKNSYFLK